MPTNANTFNSRVTSEALEAKFRDVFPSQGGAELPQDLFASGVIQPVIDFSSVAEGSVLPESLQQAWDLATDFTVQVNAGAQTLINNTGFWKIAVTATGITSGSAFNCRLSLTDGLTTKRIWEYTEDVTTSSFYGSNGTHELIVFVKTGESVSLSCSADGTAAAQWRQIADVNGTLVNPLGFTFS